jgi:hypothetical protein
MIVLIGPCMFAAPLLVLLVPVAVVLWPVVLFVLGVSYVVLWPAASFHPARTNSSTASCS